MVNLKGINLLKKQFLAYINTPPKQLVLPLIGFTTYVLVIPQILYRIIPTDFSDNGYFSQQTLKTIVYILCLVFGNVSVLAIYNSLMYFVYTRKINLQKYRISPETLWPWEQDREKWRVLLKKSIISLLTNTIFFGIGVLCVWALVLKRKVIVEDYLPPYSTIIWQMFVFLLIQDLTSTFTHTLLHTPFLYKLHKKHHEYTTTVSIAAEYAHPIEFILSNSLPTVIGFKMLAYFCQVHIVSAVTWLMFRIILTSDLHSGYMFPWDFYKLIPFAAPASYHDYHHSHNVGNFASSFMFVEALNGNNHEYYEYIENKRKKQGFNQKNIKQEKNN